MKIDLLRYKNNLPAVSGYLKINSNLSFNDKMTNLSISTHMPLLVVAYYIMKIEGSSPEFEAAIKSLTNFYKYDEPTGIKELMEL